MLRGVLIGLLILVLVVFAYVGYSGYATGKSSGSVDAYTNGMAGGRTKVEPTGATTPAATMPTTAEPNGGTSGMVAQGGAGSSAGVGTPASDSIAPNPPNGMTFGGSGHFQLYRQGDLTWRLNTDTGETCVILATDEEWRKPKVFKAGCRGRS